MNRKMKDCAMTGLDTCIMQTRDYCAVTDLCIVYSPVIHVVPPWRLHCVHNGDFCGITVTCMYSVQTDDSYDLSVTHALCTDR